MIRAAESSKTPSACNLSLRLSMPGVVSFLVLSRDVFLCLGLIKGSELLAEAMLFALLDVTVVDTMIVFTKLW